LVNLSWRVVDGDRISINASLAAAAKYHAFAAGWYRPCQPQADWAGL